LNRTVSGGCCTAFAPASVLSAKDIATRAIIGNDVGALPSSSSTWMTNVDVPVTSLSPCRPTVNSLLHLLGSWLLEGSLVGVHVYGSDSKGLMIVTPCHF